ncbi:hypothetical protein BDY24DRAFT_379851 [Mrakia frigida]|uniref:nuclear transport factor 2 family protein n=1 Tax=Mrakia frigida TaxID=29902 RepID=UPI003FCC1F4D
MSSSLFTIAQSLVRAMNEMDLDKIAPSLHHDFHHRVFPAIMRPAGVPEEGAGKELWLMRAKGLSGLIGSGSLGINIDDPISVVESADSVVLLVNSDGKLNDGTSLKLEYVYIFKFKDEKVISLDEFLDSAGAIKAFRPSA